MENLIEILKAEIKRKDRFAYTTWGRLSEQEQTLDIFNQLVDLYKDDLLRLSSLWEETCDKIKNENDTIITLAFNNANESFYDFKRIWDNTSNTQKLRHQKDFLDFCHNAIFHGKEYNAFNLIELAPPEMISSIWENVVEIIKEYASNKNNRLGEMEEDFDIEPNAFRKSTYIRQLGEFLEKTPKDIQIQKKESIKSAIFTILNEDEYYLQRVWKSVKIQDELWDEVLQEIKDSGQLGAVASLLDGAERNLQKEKLPEIEELFEKNDLRMLTLWNALDGQLQEENFDKYVEKCGGNIFDLAMLFAMSKPEVQNKHIDLLDNLILRKSG